MKPKLLRVVVLLALGLSTGGCSEGTRTRTKPVITPELAAVSRTPSPEAEACARCHPKAYEEWLGSQHARANRLVDDTLDGPAFSPARIVEHGSNRTTLTKSSGGFAFTYADGPGRPVTYHAEAVIGITPLRQYLVSASGGRLQTTDVAYDPRSNDWFYTFADERAPGEWGHWTGRGMTWNVQCAFCHMTGFEKNYDPATDTYASTWKAMGISCSQCHRVDDSVPPAGDQCPVTRHPEHRNTVSNQLDTCASCHARREELTGAFRAGERFDEHYRLMLPDQRGLYYADGQVREEDFEYGSFRMSRMGHKGVTCRDCHNPHSGRLVAPAENNALCLQCHTPPGLKGAIPVDPVAHSFHAPGSTGSLCVNCHMPITHYMVRDPRRDHGFTRPDPTLTRELGIPNACNSCHTTQTVAWAESWTATWYGEKMDSLARRRARAVARAWEGDATVVTSLLALAQSEEVVAWRSVLTSLLEPWNRQPDVRAYLDGALGHAEPMIRAAALRALVGAPDAHARLAALRRDPARLVRLDAALATANPLEQEATSVKEVAAYLKNICDQPAGALRNAEHSLNVGRKLDAESWALRAVTLDPSAQPQYALGQILYRNEKLPSALAAFERAASLDTNHAEYAFTLALIRAESGDHPGARRALQDAVQRAPTFGRAWYNLGLEDAQANDLSAAAEHLTRAEALLPESADPVFALATIHLRQGDVRAAVEAARRALARDPAHREANQLLRQYEARLRSSE